eukprot:g1407.t1
MPELMAFARAKAERELSRLRRQDFEGWRLVDRDLNLDTDGDGLVQEGEFMASATPTAGHDAHFAMLHDFYLADSNGDHALNATERHLLMHPEFSSRRDARARQHQAEQAMLKADADGNESLSFAEWWNYASTAPAEESRLVAALGASEDLHHAEFDAHDRDSDGALDDAELSDLQASLLDRPMHDALLALLDELDTNKSNKLSRTEVNAQSAQFVEALQTLEDVQLQHVKELKGVGNGGQAHDVEQRQADEL